MYAGWESLQKPSFPTTNFICLQHLEFSNSGSYANKVAGLANQWERSLENYLFWKGSLKLWLPFGFIWSTVVESYTLEAFPFVCQNPKKYDLDESEHVALRVLLITKKGKVVAVGG